MKAIINALNKELTIHLNKKRKGIYWNYDGVDMSYGPFRSDQQAINDAKLYSQYGTTSKAHIWDPFWTLFDTFLKKRALLRINNVFLLRIKKCVKK